MKIELDAIHEEVRVDGAIVPFTRKEYDVFALLWQNSDKTCPTRLIQDAVWRGNEFGSENLVPNTMKRIRAKLHNTQLQGKILTRVGFGYVLKTT